MLKLARLAPFLAVVGLIFAKDNGLAKTPQMGWNSWNHFACDISETLIRETIDAMINLGLVEMGYNYVNLDDCWQASERSSTDGSVVPDSSRFPSGMKALSAYAHSKGLQFGIYSSAGFKTCQAFPASLGVEDIDAASYAAWGVDYLKYDNCYTDHGSPLQRYPPMAKALDNSGRNILYSMCEWGRENPAAWAGEYANSWRVSGDIYDGWKSILSRAAIDASLWRYAGPGGWNDPDMLEVGNGKCSDEEYRYHFSLWAMLKAPLIIGNDVRNLTKGDPTMQILGNTEVIAVNQDPLGRQARRVWSDVMEKQGGDRLIATKCATGKKDAYEDHVLDQQWSLQKDGTIKSKSTGNCLHELTPSESEQLAVDASDHTFGLWGVSTAACTEATKWTVGEKVGGSVVSQTTGRCLEVSKFELEPLVQGKRVQTASCDDVTKKQYLDVREHQSWTSPKGKLLNLYQRQCLTVDRDAPSGLIQEVWSVPMADGSTVVLLANKGPVELPMTVTWSMLGFNDRLVFRARDLWKHADLKLPAQGNITALVRSHGVAMLKLTPVTP